MKVYKATIVKFSDVCHNDFGFEYEITYENFSKADCVKQGDYMVDLDNNKKYYILKRTPKGTLAESERYKIRLGTPYVFSYHENKKVKPTKYLKALKMMIDNDIKGPQKTLKKVD